MEYAIHKHIIEIMKVFKLDQVTHSKPGVLGPALGNPASVPFSPFISMQCYKGNLFDSTTWSAKDGNSANSG